MRSRWPSTRSTRSRASTSAARPSGVDATLVVRTGILPVIDTGIAGREPGIGQVGAGIVSPRPSVFVDAVNALAERAQQAHVH